MAVTKLSLYKDAITAIGGRRLSSLTEDRKSRRILDDVWDDGRMVDACLEAGPWAFSTRTVRLDYDPSVEPDFGFSYGFEKPTDYVQTIAIASDEFFHSPLESFADETGYWWCDLEEIYVKYTSNDSSYGLDYTKWPESFKEFFVLSFAHRACFNITHNEARERLLEGRKEKARIVALGKDGLKKPVNFIPIGRFQAARSGGFSSRYDRAGRF